MTHDDAPDQRASSIELTFDDATDARVRAEWDALAAAGLSSLAPHTSPSNAPHVSLLERRAPLPKHLDLDPYLTGTPLPLRLVLGPPALLGAGDRRVLARVVLPTPGLLELQARVRTAAGPGDDADHVLPGRWLPHVTLARRLRVVDVPRALDLLAEPIEAAGVAVRRWDPRSGSITVVAHG